ncbi:Neurogenic locus Notch protein [Diplonema papillatum]|nr:Neurogenic locus Notch protein [Diplonema papillatum]
MGSLDESMATKSPWSVASPEGVAGHRGQVLLEADVLDTSPAAGRGRHFGGKDGCAATLLPVLSDNKADTDSSNDPHLPVTKNSTQQYTPPSPCAFSDVPAPCEGRPHSPAEGGCYTAFEDYMETDGAPKVTPPGSRDARSQRSGKKVAAPLAESWCRFLLNYKRTMAAGFVVVSIATFIGALSLVSATTLDVEAPSHTASRVARAALGGTFPLLRETSTFALIATRLDGGNVSTDDRFEAFCDEFQTSIYDWVENQQLPHDFVLSLGDYFNYTDEGMPGLASRCVSADWQRALVTVDVSSAVSSQATRDFAAFLNGLAALPGYDTILTGTPIFEREAHKATTDDLKQLVAFVLPITMLVMAFLLRSLRLVVISGLTLGFSTCLTFCFGYLLSNGLFVATYTPPFVFALLIATSGSYSLVLLHRYREALTDQRRAGLGLDGSAATKQAIVHAGESVLVSGTTLAFTFWGLCIYPASTIQAFGVICGTAVTTVVASTLTVTPLILLAHQGLWEGAVKENWWWDVWDRFWSYNYCKKRDEAERDRAAAEVPEVEYDSDWNDSFRDVVPHVSGAPQRREDDDFWATGGLFNDADGVDRTSIWYLLAAVTTRFPWSIVVIVLVVGALIPVDLKSVTFDVTADVLALVPSDSQVLRGYEELGNYFTYGEVYPYYILFNATVGAPNITDPPVWAQTLGFLESVAGTAPGGAAAFLDSSDGGCTTKGHRGALNNLTEIGACRADNETSPACPQLLRAWGFVSEDQRSMWVKLTPPFAPMTSEGRSWLKRARLVAPPMGFFHVYFSGESAEVIDSMEEIYSSFGAMIAVTTVAVFLFCVVAFKCVLIPARAIVTRALNLLFVYGLVSFTYCDGHFEWLGQSFVSKTKEIVYTNALIALPMLVGFGLGPDILLMTRVVECRKDDWNNNPGQHDPMRRATILGVYRTGHIISAAGTIMFVCFACLLLVSKVSVMNQLAFFMAAGLLFETFVSRPLIVPAATWQEDNIVSVFNVLRAHHGVCNLTYSGTIAQWTKASAGFQNSCKKFSPQHNSNRRNPNDGNRKYGETLYVTFGQKQLQDWDTAHAAYTWYCREENCYDYKTGKSDGNSVTGHFTQVVWKTSVEVGCALCHQKDTTGKWNVFLMCNYYMEGNTGAYTSNVLDPGTKPTGCTASTAEDECKASPCGTGQKCADPDQSKLDDYKCTCDNDASATAVGKPATCTTDECDADPCGGNDQTCTDPDTSATSLDDYKCKCKADTSITSTGKPATCEKDECAATANLCGSDQTCKDPDTSLSKTGDYKCTCKADTSITATGTPATCEKDECAATANLCGSDQTCNDPDTSKTGDYTCKCKDDASITSTGKPATCEKDECAATANLCGSDQTCKDPDTSLSKTGDYKCTCKADTSITATGGPATCTQDECAKKPCGDGQTCKDDKPTSTGDYVCKCTNGIEATGAAAVCEVNECDATPCGSGQTCDDPNKSAAVQHDFKCKCTSDPSIVATDGPATCDKDECTATPCGAGQTCNDPKPSPKSTGDFVCKCGNGVTATGAPATCELDECATTPCGSGQTCADDNKASNSLHDFKCTCSGNTAISAVDGPATCEKNECDSKPCGAQTCQDPDNSPTSTGDYTCTCANGVSATGGPAACDNDECTATPAPCGAGQTCADANKAANALSDFTCTCSSDASIKNTGAPATCTKNECDSSPCGTGQTCNDPNPSPNNLNDFTCTCSNGVVATGAGAACDDNECTTNPCGAGQSCNDPKPAANSLHDFVCTCSADASITSTDGPATCAKDECDPSPCGAGQTCNDPDKSPKKTSDYVCSCSNGVTATGAAAVCDTDECTTTPSPCGAGQTCSDPNKAASSLHDFVCTCAGDATLKKVNGPATCSKNECEPNPCPAGQTCEDTNQSPQSTADFVCSCPNGVKATGGGATCEANECDATPCGTEASCADPNPAADSQHDFVCTCNNDNTITRTDGQPVCVTNECDSKPCGSQTCDDPNTSATSLNDFTCTCAGGTPSATGKAAVCTAGTTDECAATPCGAGQDCVDTNQGATALNDFVCSCKVGAGSETGKAATCTLDECDVHPCGTGQDCEDSNTAATALGGFTCTCRLPKVGSNVGQEAQCRLNECDAKPCGTQTCLDPSTAVGSLHDFTCTCPNGVSATNTMAVCELNECDTNPCGNGQTCNDPNLSAARQHDFECKCTSDPTIVQVDGPATCTKDECLTTPCAAGQTCNDANKAAGSLNDYHDFVCKCNNDATLTRINGPATCERNECGTDPCKKATTGQTCQDPNVKVSSLTDFTCTCANGAKATGAVATCETDECANSPCGTGQTCTDPDKASNKLHNFKCACNSDNTITLVDGPATCERDECASQPCAAGQTCQDSDKSITALHDFTCTCDNGVVATGTAATCVIDECAATPCGIDQTCTDPNKAKNSQHDYECVCNKDSSLRRVDGPAACQKDECASVPCGDKQTCVDPVQEFSSLLDYTCTCDNGVVATAAVAMCEVDECEANPCGTSGAQTCEDPNKSQASHHDFVCTCVTDSSISIVDGPATCEKNECDANPPPCGDDQMCEDPDWSMASLRDFVCSCEKGTRIATGGRVGDCGLDECLASPCSEGQVCDDSERFSRGDYTCSCPRGTRRVVNASVATCDECDGAAAQSGKNPCGEHVNATCRDPNPSATSVDDFICSCPDGTIKVGEPADCGGVTGQDSSDGLGVHGGASEEDSDGDNVWWVILAVGGGVVACLGLGLIAARGRYNSRHMPINEFFEAVDVEERPPSSPYSKSSPTALSPASPDRACFSL